MLWRGFRQAAAPVVRRQWRLMTSVPITASDFKAGMGEAAAAHVGGDAQIVMVPCLDDNYAPLIHDPATGATAVIDTPEVGPILAAAKEKGWKLTHILNTHHHADHTGGNIDIKQETQCQIVGPADEAKRIPGIDTMVSEGDCVSVGNFKAHVIDVRGHTAGHVAFHFPEQNVAFVGDTLFNLGCGRLFEGTPSQMWSSLSKLAALPDETVVYCAHEYTEANLRFATHVGGNPKLAEKAEAIKELRSDGKATVPMLLLHEKETNPFLRAESKELKEAVGLPEGAPALDVFTEVRRRKDRF